MSTITNETNNSPGLFDGSRSLPGYDNTDSLSMFQYKVKSALKYLYAKLIYVLIIVVLLILMYFLYIPIKVIYNRYTK
jgi:hypothetical protein